MEKNPLDGYFKETAPEKYRFLGYYQFRQKQRDFTSNFRLEAQRLSKCLWFLSEHGSNVEKRAARRLLDNFENHRRKNKDINQFWSGIEFDEQFIASPPSSFPLPTPNSNEREGASKRNGMVTPMSLPRSKAAPAARNAKEELVALEDDSEALEDRYEESQESDSDDSNLFEESHKTPKVTVTYRSGKRSMAAKDPPNEEETNADVESWSKDFFDKTDTSEWTCDNVVRHCQENIGRHATLKKILYSANMDLKEISKSASDELHKTTARYIVDNWKDWVAPAKELEKIEKVQRSLDFSKKIDDLLHVHHHIRATEKAAAQLDVIQEGLLVTSRVTTGKRKCDSFSAKSLEKSEEKEHNLHGVGTTKRSRSGQRNTIVLRKRKATGSYATSEDDDDDSYLPSSVSSGISEEIIETLTGEAFRASTPSSSPKKAMGTISYVRNEAKMLKFERSKSNGETDICDESGSDNDSEPKYESFTRAYNSMKNDKKWCLSTGTIVEDALYNFGIKCTYEHLCHSFVIDPNDKNYLNEGIFTQKELEEIRGFRTKVLPPVPRDILLYLDSFRTKTTADLRRLVFRQEAMDQNFDRHKDFDRDWIRSTIYNLLREYEADSLAEKHLELWLLIHIWSFIDRAFEDIPGIEAVRGESCCLASSTRKNEKRTVAALVTLKRKMLGRRGDLIIRKISTEYGCAEAGRLFEGEKGTKLLREKGLKTSKMLKDIFNSLCAAVDGDEEKVRKLESVGFLHAGLTMSLLRLDSPAGYTCRVSCSKLLEIPSQIAEFSSKALPVILLTWRAKTIIANMIRLVEEGNELDEDDEEDRLQHLLNSCETPSSPKRMKVDLPPAQNTPQKKRKKKKFINRSIGATCSIEGKEN